MTSCGLDSDGFPRGHAGVSRIPVISGEKYATLKRNLYIGRSSSTDVSVASTRASTRVIVTVWARLVYSLALRVTAHAAAYTIRLTLVHVFANFRVEPDLTVSSICLSSVCRPSFCKLMLQFSKVVSLSRQSSTLTTSSSTHVAARLGCEPTSCTHISQQHISRSRQTTPLNMRTGPAHGLVVTGLWGNHDVNPSVWPASR
jgi:hypothetical protein